MLPVDRYIPNALPTRSEIGVSAYVVNLSRIISQEATMKATLIPAFALLAAIAFPFSAHAANPAQVKQLLETGACAQCNLAGADLEGAHLIGADLRNANLRGANLKNANLEGADLTGADLKNADMTGSFATNAVFNQANLGGVNLANARMINALTFGAKLDGINFAGADIYGSGIGVGGER
jgi:uncharacterized protein YjbI with pentapeptide repeats